MFQQIFDIQLGNRDPNQIAIIIQNRAAAITALKRGINLNIGIVISDTGQRTDYAFGHFDR